jgi:hypothetical protein
LGLKLVAKVSDRLVITIAIKIINLADDLVMAATNLNGLKNDNRTSLLLLTIFVFI